VNTTSSKDIMADHESSDPWDSLAESLGASPAEEPAPAARPAPPRPSRRRSPPAASRPPSPPPAADWDSLAAELGLPGGARPASLDREPTPAERRPTRERNDDDLAAAGAAAEGSEADRPAEAREGDEDGPPRRRRRRGRRSGRGRRREADGDGRAVDESGDEPSRERRDEPPPRRRRAAATIQRPDEDVSEAESWREDLDAGFVEPPAAGDEPVDAAVDGDEEPAGDRPRKRRRRGRRGGRGRGRGATAREERAGGEASADEDLADEPMPASYGSRPVETAETTEPAATPERGSGEGEGSRSRGRRRRRSRREAGESPRRQPSAGRTQDRRDRKRSDSRSSHRGRRSDFAPVAGRYEEDDEGLEFLGVEEAARDTPPRSRAPAEDDEVLAESGLTSVLDVPSWVEAIGIVIAGNLAARTKSGRSEAGRGR
jgi:hypothetical protein